MVRICFCVLILILPDIANAGMPSVVEQNGNIVCIDAKTQPDVLTSEGLDTQPAMSPDGHTVAFIRTEEKATQEGEPDFTALWIGDCQTRRTSRLMGPRPDNTPKTDLASMSYPVFSLDGGFVYVLAPAWVTSGAIHQVNIHTGTERYVTDSNSLSVIRTGPYRGYLLVQKHLYHKNGDGSYDPSFVFRPDGKWKMMVPGTEDGDDEAVEIWLKKSGWTAW